MVRVEITPIVAPADAATVAKRTDIAQRLDRLGHIDASAGQVNGLATTGWQASINGTAIPIGGYAVEQDGDRVLLSLALAPDEISIRQSVAQQSADPAPAEKLQRRSAWGDRSKPDPREGIPGWDPSLGEQVARNAEATA